MLNKEVCKQCYRKYNWEWIEREWLGYEVKFNMTDRRDPRSYYDDSHVHCPPKVSKNYNVVANRQYSDCQPPDYCPYFLEHIMETQDAN